MAKKKKKTTGRNLLIFFIVGVIIFCTGFILGYYSGMKSAVTVADGNNTASGQEDSENRKVSEMISSMTLSEKIYQMMFVTPESITGIGQVIKAGEATKEALSAKPVGGIIYFTPNFQSVEQTKEMIENTQSYSKIPLFIGVDEEGGRVSRLGSNEKMGIKQYPPMREIGDSKDEGIAYGVGTQLGIDLSELGFNVDFAPVADVILSDKNTEIGDRAFSTDAQVVSSMVKQIVFGLQENGVSATLKHFPGHGSTTTDSHTGYSQSERTLEELRSCEFLPFEAGIEAGADFVLVSHMTLVNATKEKVPSSVSGEVIQGMLTDELGFEGIVITDSFQMGAITKELSPEEAAVKAVEAGADMILMPSDVEVFHDAILKAVESGRISEDRIDRSVEKVLRTKLKRKLI